MAEGSKGAGQSKGGSGGNRGTTPSRPIEKGYTPSQPLNPQGGKLPPPPPTGQGGPKPSNE